jgi:hypothetical protein
MTHTELVVMPKEKLTLSSCHKNVYVATYLVQMKLLVRLTLELV